MKEFRVLLIHANSTLDTLIPPNLAIISAILKREKIDVKLFDTTFYKTRESTGDDARVKTLQVKRTDFDDLDIHLNTSDMYDDFIAVTRKYQPDLVGLSAVSLTFPFGIDFLRRLKQDKYDIPTIVGGIHATISPEEVLKEDSVDFVCRGEGEFALVDLCNALSQNESTTNIENIWAKKDGKIHKNKPRPPVDINTLPFQDWSIFDEKRIYKPMGGKIRRTGCFELDRGCPYSCNYCCNDFWHEFYDRKNYRKKDVSRFIEEVKFMKQQHSVEFVYLASETFLASNEERLSEFAKLWKEEIGLPFWSQTRPETITPERIQLLKDSGLSSMGVGVESGSPEIRRKMNRGTTNERILAAFDTLNQFGIRFGVNIIVGYPDETREQIFETIDLVRKIKASNIMTHVFNPYRGTHAYSVCVEKGYIPKTEMGGDYRQDFVLNMPQITQEEIKGLQRTFALYVKLPKERWPEIKLAEQMTPEGNQQFEKLKKEYTEKFLGGY